MHWSQSMQDRLAGLAGEDLSAQQIATKLSHEFRIVISRNAVIGRAQRTKVDLHGAHDVPLKVIEPPPPPVGRFTLNELEEQHCRFLIGDLYCGDARVWGSSYCAFHRAATSQGLKYGGGGRTSFVTFRHLRRE